MLRALIVANVIKTRIGCVWSISSGMGSVVLVIHVERVTRVFVRFVEKVQWIPVPYNVHILKQKVYAKETYQLNTNDLGHHHGCKVSITVFLGSFTRNATEILATGTGKQSHY